MTLMDAKEAAVLLRVLLKSLIMDIPNQETLEAATLRQRADALYTTALPRVQAWDFGADLLACFTAATAAGATLTGFASFIGTATALSPVGRAAVTTVQSCIRFAAMQETRIISATTFVSRDDVDAALAFVNTAFDPIEEYAADSQDGANYQALVSLHAAVVRDLSARGRQLPRVVTYAVAHTVPSLVLAQRLYGDPTRADELVGEGKVLHPLFMPRTGRALTA